MVVVCAQDKRVEAFLFKERSLVLRQKLYGPSHKVVTDCAKDLTLQYSVVAMDLIRGGDTVESLKLLEKAQILSSSEVLFPEELPRKQLLAVMYNNFGCYYKLYVRVCVCVWGGLPFWHILAHVLRVFWCSCVLPRALLDVTHCGIVCAACPSCTPHGSTFRRRC